jgi:hypothetical protein
MKEGFDSFICRDRERYKIFLEPNLSPLQIGGLGEERVFIANKFPPLKDQNTFHITHHFQAKTFEPR